MENTTKPSRTTNPEYAALRAATEATLLGFTKAEKDLIALVRKNGYIRSLIAEELLTKFPDDSDTAQIGARFRAAASEHEAAWSEQSTWIDAHPEYR